jgi:hypothetical protein
VDLGQVSCRADGLAAAAAVRRFDIHAYMDLTW